MDSVSFLVHYTQLYVLLVVIPAYVRLLIDRFVLKIEDRYFLLPSSTNFSNAVNTALIFPLVEELAFRGAPLAFLGYPGLIIANAIWVIAHPAWQLSYLPSGTPRSIKIGFILNSAFFYSCGAVFYTYAWLAGYGLYAVIFHIMHNSLIIIASTFAEAVKVRYVKPEIFAEKKTQERKTFVPEIFVERTPSSGVIDFDVDLTDLKFFKDFGKTPSSSFLVLDIEEFQEPWIFF